MGKKIIVFLIQIYQRFFSPAIHWLSFSFFGTRSGCRFNPTCSQYAAEVFANKKFFKALRLVFERLKHCHPF